MEQWIKLKQSTDSMSQNEMEQLAPDIVRILGKDNFVNLLCKHFRTPYRPGSKHQTQLQQINARMSAFVNENAISISPLKLDTMHEPLINKICSYLDYWDYTRFEQCNRNIFIAARSPFQLQHLDACDHRMIHKSNSYKFRRVQSLQAHWQLQSMFQSNVELCSLRKFVHSVTNESLMHLTLMFQTQRITFEHLTHLFIGNGSMDWRRTVTIQDTLNFMLPHCEVLNYLNIHHMSNTGITLNATSLCTINKLKGLAIAFGQAHHDDEKQRIARPLVIPSERDIVNACSPDLVSFHTGSELVHLNFNDKKFPNVTELCLKNNFDPNVISLIATFKHLKRMRFDISALGCREMELDSRLINGLLAPSKLQSIDFGLVFMRRVPLLLTLLENGLAIHKKQRLKIYLQTYIEEDDIGIEDAFDELTAFVHAIHDLIPGRFDFVFSAEEFFPINDVREWLASLDSNRFSTLCNGRYFVVSKNNAMSTIRKEWTMTCETCSNCQTFNMFI
eukprot:689427_1